MHDRVRSDGQPDRPEPASAAKQNQPAAMQPPQPGTRVTAADALALQRAVGNRAAARTLARWAAHPDKDKKGQFLTDSAAAEYTRFNPPKND